MPKVNKEPVVKNRMNCVCRDHGMDANNMEVDAQNCVCSLVNQRDTGKKYHVKDVKMQGLGMLPQPEKKVEDSIQDLFSGIL